MVRLLYALLLLATFGGCSKDKIDVSTIYKTDQAGNPMGTFPNDGQWKQQSLSSSELSLFKELDTANLAGTIMPTISKHYYATPNPFSYSFNVYAAISDPAPAGSIIVKYVIVNRDMKPVKKGAVRVFMNYGIVYAINGDFYNGKYRMYFTYSAEGHENFFTGYGNIQKI